MLDLNEMFVYDAVTHSYNMSPSNYRNEQHAERITEMLFGNVSSVVSDEYTFTLRASCEIGVSKRRRRCCSKRVTRTWRRFIQCRLRLSRRAGRQR